MLEEVEDRLRTDVSKAEEAFGFDVAEEPSGVRALVRELRPGLRALKVEADGGSVEYAICPESFRPVYRAAKTLEEQREPLPVRLAAGEALTGPSCLVLEATTAALLDLR